MEFETLETDRLILRKLTEKEYRYIFNDFSDAEIQPLLGFKTLGDVATQRAKVEKGFTTHNRSFLVFDLVDKPTRAVVGHCGFHTWYTDHDRAEIGYALVDDHTKAKGLMSEALAAILAYGFGEMQLHRVEAFIGPENIASLKLVEKFGFVKEGHLRQHYFKNGRYEDSIVFSLLKHEFRP